MCSLENPKWKDVSSQSCKAGSGFGGGRSRRQLYAAKEKKTNTAEVYRLISRFVALFDGIQACKSDFSCSHAGKMIVKLKDTLSLKCINTMTQTNMSYSMKSFVGLSKSCFLIQRLLEVCSHFYTSIVGKRWCMVSYLINEPDQHLSFSFFIPFFLVWD